jgi:small subunit ribosomal protein S27Ae|tara:strand:+ start:75 stop:326 length:252 start_codon:yes stop_codon:yes gene_type:complete
MAEESKPGEKIVKKKTSKRYENYEVSGSTVKRKNKSCPKCGPGILLANHSNRVYCGKCGYVEMKESEAKVEAPKEKPAEDKKE